MLRFIVARIIQFPLILAVIYLVTFALVWIVPGSPFEQDDRALPAHVLEARKRELNAEHWYTFLAHYPKMVVLEGDFGPSLTGAAFGVNERLKQQLPVSMVLGATALAIAVVAGVSIGVVAAVRRGSIIDWLSLSIAMVGISVPAFAIAAFLLIIFSVKLEWFPIQTWTGSMREYVLPAIALSLMPMAYIARLTRVAMLDTLSADFVRTARAKGLSKHKVVWKHCLRIAFLPVLSFLGPAAAATLTGSFVVESVFDVPGMGRTFVDSVLNRDITLILGVVMIYSTLLLALNLLVDVTYVLVDPRIEMASG